MGEWQRTADARAEIDELWEKLEGVEMQIEDGFATGDVALLSRLADESEDLRERIDELSIWL